MTQPHSSQANISVGILLKQWRNTETEKHVITNEDKMLPNTEVSLEPVTPRSIEINH